MEYDNPDNYESGTIMLGDGGAPEILFRALAWEDIDGEVFAGGKFYRSIVDVQRAYPSGRILTYELHDVTSGSSANVRFQDLPEVMASINSERYNKNNS